MGWTDEQREAIQNRSCNLLVSAAAGSGKTAVLVERIINLLVEDKNEDKLDIDRMLVVTFTQAAAGEMRERISAAIIAELAKGNSDEQHLRRQLMLLGRASISTIHAFCTEVLRTYFYLVNLDPQFRIADAAESELLKLEVAEVLMEMEYEKNDPLFLELVERFSTSRSDQGLQDLILRLYNFIQSQPAPLEWLSQKVEEYNLDRDNFMRSRWMMVLKPQLISMLEEACERFQEAITLSQMPSGPYPYMEALVCDLQNAQHMLHLLKHSDLDGFYNFINQAETMRLKKVNKDADPDLTALTKQYRQEGKDLINEIGGKIFSKSPSALLNDMREIYPCLQYLLSVLEEFTGLYEDKKAEKGLIDFNDLEHYALRILANPEVQREYRERFSYIFVDEYQDSNLVQETIINYIKREDNLFLVGDVKQSIYRFRLADPTLFLAKMAAYSPKPGERDRRIDLKTNFRSAQPVIDAVNYLFGAIMSENLGEVSYDERARLYRGIEGGERGEAVEVHLLEKKQELDESEELPLDHMQREAAAVAQRIKKLLQEPLWDVRQQKYRLLEYKDMVILLRATGRWAPVFTEVLLAEGIPVYADVGSGYFASVEISIIMNLLRLIDNRYQDIALLSVMRSPLAEFTLDEMIQIRMCCREGFFYQALEEYLVQNDDTLSQKLASFWNKLAEWKKESRWMPVDEFIWKLLSETAYFNYCGAMPGGVQRQANLRILLDRARQFQESSMRGLYNFLKYVDKLQSSSGDMGMARVLGENDNVVRIMSIHKSKGLEFPVVIVAGLGQQFNMSDSRSVVLLHRELGLGPRLVKPDLRTYTDTLPRMIISKKIALESLSEEMRVLYVAMTRAESKLILFASVSDLPNKCAKWSREPSVNSLARAVSFMDWIGPVLMKHADGSRLREMAGLESAYDSLWADGSSWIIKIYENMDADKEKTAIEEIIQEVAAVVMDDQAKMAGEAAEAFRRLEWTYPHRLAVNLPSKISATQLSQQGKQEEIHFISLKTNKTNISLPIISASQRGSINHLVLQHLHFKQLDCEENIKYQLNKMIEREILRPEEADIVNIQNLLQFFRSDLGQRVMRADEVWREKPFNLVISADQFLQNEEAQDCNDKLLLQGVIDLYFREGNELVLVDYKTGLGEKESIMQRYRAQIAIYRQALESILKKKVKESYLYMLDKGDIVLVE